MPFQFPFYRSNKLKDIPKPRKLFKELGASGVQFFSGMISGEEYLTELTGSNAITVYDKMRRSDSQIRGTLYAITLPIRQAKWYVEPPTDKPADKEIAERIEKNLLTEMIITWDDFLRQALNYLAFGYSIFEKVLWLTEDKKILLKKLAPRLQKTLHKWLVDENGNLEGIQQYVQMANGKFEYPTIPIEKLALFVNDQEGANYEGISVLRSSYKNWYIKDQLYKIDAIGHDRWASGVPVMTEPESPNEADEARVAKILSNLHSREKSYVHLPNGWEFNLFEKKGSNESIIKSIQHHNEEIAKNVLAQFISLGTSSTGSRALGESFEELFMQSLNAVAGYIADNINRYVIHPLVDMNWNVKEYPMLKASRIMLNMTRWLEGLGKIGLANGITRDNDIENVLRDTLGFPELSPEVIEEREKIKQKIVDGGNDEDNSGEGDEEDKRAIQETESKKLKEFKRKRELTDIEKALADFDEIEFTFNDRTEKYKKQILKIRKQQAESVSKQVITKPADRVKVPFVGKLADRLFDEAMKSYRKGRKHLNEEIARQKEAIKRKTLQAPELLEGDEFQDSEEVIQYLKDKSNADATTLSDKVKLSGLFFLYNIDPTGKSKGELANEIEKSINTSGLKDVESIAGASTNKAYGMGRETMAVKYANQIEIAIYSAVLDGNTCEVCEPLDGRRHSIDNHDFQTPNPECAGGGKCRCINIYVLKGMEV